MQSKRKIIVTFILMFLLLQQHVITIKNLRDSYESRRFLEADLSAVFSFNYVKY